MKISLLYPGTVPDAPDTEVSERLTGDLMLDESFSCFFPDINKRRFFLSVVSEPQSDPDIPIYRAEILRDFCAKPNLLDGLCAALRKLVKMRDEQQADRTQFFTLIRGTDSESAYITSSGLAEVSSTATNKALHALSGIGELLRIYPVQSRGLAALRDRITALTRGEKFAQLTDLFGLTSHLSFDDTFTLNVKLNEYANVALYELTGVVHPVPEEEVTGLRRLFNKRPARDACSTGIRVDDRWGKLRNELLGGALRELADLAYAISKAIFDEFVPLLRELHFYEAGAAYVAAMRNKKLPLCYPEITENGQTKYTELYDLYLCTSYPNAAAIVPNDADLSHGSIIVTGANNTGKTVFLRSVGTAQLLAQSGLPVIAREATVRMRSGVWTLYAAAEKEFAAGNDAGRFEQEVRLLSDMLDKIKPGALVLLNEIFQTTAYSEGAEGLHGILRYLHSPAIGADYIAVTHLTDLIGLLGSNAVHMRTLEGEQLYKLETVHN